MVRLLLLSLFFIGCVRLHNTHNEDVLDCGPELTRGQDYFTVVSSQGIRLVSGFEVIDLNSGRPENLVTSKGCVVKKAEGRFLIRSTGTDDAQIIDMREYEKYSRVELSDYSGQSVSIACKDDVQTVSNAFTIQSILQTNLQPNLRAAIQLEYAFSSPMRPGAAFNLTQASQALPLRGEIDERIYELRVVVSNLLRMGKVEATCRLQLDRTPPEVFVSVNSKRPEEMIEVHGTANIVPVGLIDSISFLASKNDGVTVYYCLVPLDDDFDSANMEARKIWKSRTESKNCDDSKRLISPLGSAIASDVKSGFWSIKFQSSDAVGNVSSPQNQTILVLNKDYHRLIRENVLASLGSKSSRRVVDSALRAEVLRNNLPTRYERDLEKDTALSGLLRAYYQETVSIEINAHHSSVRAIALSEDGQVLVSSSFDRTLKLWNVDTGQNIWSVNSEVFSSIAISPDRKYIVGIDQTGSILAFDAMDGRYLRVIKARDRSTLVSTQIQFGPDSQSVLINSGNDIEIRSFESGEILRALKGHAKSVKDFSVVPGGEMVVSVAADKTLRFWDFETGLNLKTIETKVNSSQSIPQNPNQVTVSSDGKKIGIKFDMGTVAVWSIDGMFLNLAANMSAIRSIIAVKPDGTVFTADKDIKVWDADNLIGTFSEHVSPIVAMAISRDQKRLFTASDDSTIRIWNLRIIREKKILEAPHEVTSLVYSQDAETLISGSLASGELLLWSPGSSDRPKTLARHKSGVGALSISGNGKYLASGGSEGDIIVQEYPEPCCRLFEFKPAEAVSSVSLSNDGRYLVAATTNGGTKLWDLSGQGDPRDVAGPSVGGTVAAISPDGSRIAIAGLGAQGSIEIRDRQSGKILMPISGNSGFMSGLSFSADSKRLAAFGPSSNSINVWEIQTNKVVSKLTGDFKDVVSLAMTTTGTRALAGTLIGKFHLIDFERDQEILIPMHGSLPSFAVAFAPDSRTFATGAYDKTIRIWDFDNGPIHENICNRLKSYLDTELCSGFAQ